MNANMCLFVFIRVYSRINMEPLHRVNLKLWLGGLLLCAICLSACAGPAPISGSGGASAAASAELALPDGFRAEVYARGLSSPTALAWGPDGSLYITQLSGGENAATGQVIAVDAAGAAPRVVLDGLFKPTGLAWREQQLYIAAGRDVLQSSLDAAGRLRTPTPLVQQLPYNTRSEGQIDVLPDGRVLFEASGTLNDAQSGRLLTLLPGEQPQIFATGLKNAYAHTIDPRSGDVYATDIHDEAVDGQPPPDELNLVQAGQDYGWPRCTGQRVPAISLGGSAQGCAATQPALLTLPPNSTPTGLSWYDGTDFPAPYRDVLYVALWNGRPPEVLRVVVGERDGQRTGEASTFMRGLEHPIDLLTDPDGGLLVLDYAAGVVYRVLPSS